MSEAQAEASSRASNVTSALAPQEADSARTPREGDASSPTDLVRILKDLRKEGVIVPSRQFMQMIQAERKIEAKSDVTKKEEAKKDEKKDEPQSTRVRTHLEEEVSPFRSDGLEMGDFNPFRACPPLLTTLVENVLEYCRTKLLDEELDALSMDGQGPAGRSAAAERAAQRRTRVAMLLRRCTETYGQLLLVYSEKKPSTDTVAAERVAVEGTSEGTPKWLHKRAGDRATARGRAEGTPRGRSKMDADGHSSGRARSGERGDNKSPGANTRSPLIIHPTPFFEAVYALLARAVQQGMRAAAEGSRIAQEKGGMAQLAARVDEELGRLFRSQEFGQSSGRGIRKGGAKVDAGSGTEGVESAQLAARAEAELGKLIKTASLLTSRLNSEFKALEETLHRNPQTEAKLSADQADKSAGAGGADSKDAANAAGDHAATAASVDALITWFKARAPPRQRHAEQSVALAHVISTRSPMINSLLPSPHDQALDLDRTRREYKHRPHRLASDSSRSKKLNAELILNSARSSSSTRGASEEKIDSSPPVLQNTWALAQERTLHRPASSAPPIFNSRTLVALTGGLPGAEEMPT